VGFADAALGWVEGLALGHGGCMLDCRYSGRR
jgi:hypothetical protein